VKFGISGILGEQTFYHEKAFVGFLLDLFFVHLRTDKKFRPYKKAEDILDAYRSIQSKIEPTLSTMFGKFPKTKFEIRQTETIRAARASADYNPGAPDGSRPEFSTYQL
jgi:uncharacterized protein (DUF885 family)